MSELRLCVISLRYSSWSMRPWLALQHAGARFTTDTAELSLAQWSGGAQLATDAGALAAELQKRRSLGSVTGLFPVLYVDGTPIHESLAICEWVSEAYPEAGLMPDSALARAQLRAVACEMLTGFKDLRTQLSCHLFARVPAREQPTAVQRDVARVFEIWSEALARSGGPFLFGRFSIADAMYYPVRTRFRSYGVAIPDALAGYVAALDALPAVQALEAEARRAPRLPVYDDYVRGLGGDPDAGL